MDINELKELLKGSTSVLIMDNGQPSFVVLDYQAYRNLLTKAPEADSQRPPSGMQSLGNAMTAQELEIVERLNKEIQALKQQIEEEEQNELGTE
ncbi:MAG: hypothetical protein KW806_00750 [Candidatus Yanofskybacteria bacterium]|nr:hypothetical protein [Candidatus Yanofskybacteria bacterium]